MATATLHKDDSATRDWHEVTGQFFGASRNVEAFAKSGQPGAGWAQRVAKNYIEPGRRHQTRVTYEGMRAAGTLVLDDPKHTRVPCCSHEEQARAEVEELRASLAWTRFALANAEIELVIRRAPWWRRRRLRALSS